MAQSQMMTGHDGNEVKCFYRGARNLREGDYLPEHRAYVVTDPIVDMTDESVWVTLDSDRDVRFTKRGKVWMHRTYSAPEWMREAIDNYRAARDHRDATRESSAPAPTGVAGASHSGVAWCQLEEDDFKLAYPAPRLAEFIRDAAAARREVVAA